MALIGTFKARGRALMALALALCPLASLAQAVDCGRLQAQIASLPSGDAGRGAKFSEAAARQQNEIARTLGYANSIGCDRQQFLIFGSAPPPQCGAINGQVARMRANLGQLQAQGASGGQRRELVARFEAYCRGSQVASNRSLFDGQPQLRQVPLEDAARPEAEPAEPRAPRGGGQAICVRKCDGAFFPLSSGGARASLELLGELCSALCPNAEAALYTSSGTLESARSAEGEPYTALPAAFKFRTSYDSACTCKPPHQTWVQALAEAEKLMARDKSGDIVVTSETSDDLLRGKLLAKPVEKPDVKGKAKGRAPKFDPAAAAQAIAADVLSAADDPLLGKQAAGIDAESLPLDVDQGAQRDVIGRAGVKRKVREIAPPRI